MLPSPFYLSERGSGNQRDFRILNANVNTAQGDPERLLEIISHYNPDVILLQEVGDRWLPSLAALNAEYPFELVYPKNDNFGIALYSRRPLINPQVRFIGHVDLATLTARIEFEKQDVYFIAAHTLPPMGWQNSYWRNNQLNLLGEHANAINGNVVLAGDLNATPWSGHFQEMIRNSGLRDSARGYGVQATWPVGSLLLRIPLDHCLHSSGLEVVGREVGPDIGSDHFPVIVDLVFAEAG
ncbi:MAG: hypothetical protein AMXMBFR84_36210 [Candidatus Hydrogenedentota bacterium]